jgi:hypothetical protein
MFGHDFIEEWDTYFTNQEVVKFIMSMNDDVQTLMVLLPVHGDRTLKNGQCSYSAVT